MTWLATLRGERGNAVGVMLEELHRSEQELGSGLLALADQHRTDHEVFHVARDIARWSQEHLAGLARVGRDYGLELEQDPDLTSPGLVSRMKRAGAEAMGRHHAPALLLVRDLRHVYLLAAGASVDWEVLAQTAQALKDQELLSLTQRSHPETLRQMRWANGTLKQMAPQALIGHGTTSRRNAS